MGERTGAMGRENDRPWLALLGETFLPSLGTVGLASPAWEHGKRTSERYFDPTDEPLAYSVVRPTHSIEERGASEMITTRKAFN